MDNDLERRGKVIKKGGECKVNGVGMREETEEKEKKVEMEEKMETEETEEKVDVEEKEEKECERKYWDVREEVLARYIVASWGIPRIKLVCTSPFLSFLLQIFPFFLPFFLFCKFS